jgi:peptidyl-prolyl cis-trans isomerase SurA
MKKLLVGIALIVATGLAVLMPDTRVLAQQGLRIAAIVNDDVISVHDLENRLALTMVTSNVDDRPEVRQRIAPQILRSLIDERLKVQEARRLNVVVTKKEIDDALDRIARQVKMSPEELPRFLGSRGVRMATLIDQVEAEIGWIKTVNRLEGSRIQIGEDEIDAEMARVRQNAGAPEFRVADIFLPVDSPAAEAEVRQLAERLLGQLTQGASFPSLARNFSQAASAALGGDLGWIRRGQLPEQLDAVLPAMEPGEVSAPIRTPAGYSLLLMIDKRMSEGLAEGRVIVTLSRLSLPLPANPPQQQVAERLQTARTLSQGVQTCAELEAAGRQAGGDRSGAMGEMEIGQLPDQLRQLVRPLGAGEMTPPLRTDEGVVVVMVCDRKEEGNVTEQRTLVEGMLREQSLTAASQRHLRDLRRSALIDIRI